MKLTDFDKEINQALANGYKKVPLSMMGFKRKQLISVQILVGGIELTEQEKAAVQSAGDWLTRFIQDNRNK